MTRFHGRNGVSVTRFHEKKPEIGEVLMSLGLAAPDFTVISRKKSSKRDS